MLSADSLLEDSDGGCGISRDEGVDAAVRGGLLAHNAKSFLKRMAVAFAGHKGAASGQVQGAGDTWDLAQTVSLSQSF
jgi:hypothetical protein